MQISNKVSFGRVKNLSPKNVFERISVGILFIENVNSKSAQLLKDTRFHSGSFAWKKNLSDLFSIQISIALIKCLHIGTPKTYSSSRLFPNSFGHLPYRHRPYVIVETTDNTRK